MSDSNKPKVVSTAKLVGLRLINGGDTVAMTFQGPDGSETAILIPRKAAQMQLAETLALSLDRKHYEL